MNSEVKKLNHGDMYISMLNDNLTENKCSEVPSKIPLAIIDNKPLTLSFLMNFISSSSDEYSIFPFHDHEELIRYQQQEEGVIKIIVFNVGSELLGRESYQAIIQRIKTNLSDVPLVLVAGCEDSALILQAFQLGVQGYITTSLMPAVAIAALKLVLEGGIFAPTHSFFFDLGQKLQDHITTT